MPKGVLNPDWEKAKSIAEEMGNGLDANIKRIRAEFKTLKKNGIDIELAIACWRNLRSEESVSGMVMQDARLTTVLKGSPSYLSRYLDSIFEKMPPVYYADDYDRYIEANAEVLRKLGFVYNAWASEEEKMGIRRLTVERVRELGLLGESEG